MRQTRSVTGCMHRFCKECIDKWMRLGKNECPACRKHCPSRRSLRADIRYDAMITSVYDNIDKYEEAELTLREEEKIQNRKIQASISRTLRHQSEALTARPKKRATSSSTTRLQCNYWNAYSRRRRRNNLIVDPERFEDEEDSIHSDNSASSSSEDWLVEFRRRRQHRKRARGQSSQPAPSAAKLDGGNEYVSQECRLNIDTSSGPMLNPKIVDWGGAGVWSKVVQSTCSVNLTEHIESLEDDNKLCVRFMLASLDEQKIPNSWAPYLSFPPYFSVEQLKMYIAHETQIRVEDIEIFLVKKHSTTTDLQIILDPSTSLQNKDVLHALEGQETLARLRATCANGDQLMLAYRLKQSDYCVNCPPNTSFKLGTGLISPYGK
ncbi:Ubiquitin--protein ligase [Bertholletia excelsa]